MAEWGRKKYASWPSRKPGWTIGAGFGAILFFAGMMAWQYTENWSFVERFYLQMYAKTWARGSVLPTNRGWYALLDVVNKKGEKRLAVDGEVEPIQNADGRTAYVLTDAAVAAGWVKPVWDAGWFNDQELHAYLAHWIYQDQTVWDYVKSSAYESLAVWVLLLLFAVPKDRKRTSVFKEGRRLRGPERVTTAEFNEKLGKSKGMRVHLPDGVAFINEEISWYDKTFHKTLSRWVCIPREQETKHFMVMGDTGTGKSAALTQIVIQAIERGEGMVIYDPKGTYFARFGDLSRGDVLLNPLDARWLVWRLIDEITHPAEALTLAASLFPEQVGENRFFVDATRKIFAYLLNLKPTPKELVAWLCDPKEIDKRVRGTELAAMIDPQGGPQRAGVLGSLGMVGDALKLLPDETEGAGRWSVAEWAKERKGCIFITSHTMVEESLRPLISLWIDLLVLRLMNEGPTTKRKVWFLLDEVVNLQRLPQLEKAITQGRESNCVVVLGFQGKSQMEALYGKVAEAMLSSPATKIYLKTSEPNAAEWISKAIGEVEVERYRESRTQGQFPQTRNSESQQRDITREPLVMASEISGLDDLHGYLKYGNYVVRMRLPYLQREVRNEKFIARNIEEHLPVAASPKNETAPRIEPKRVQEQQQHYFE